MWLGVMLCIDTICGLVVLIEMITLFKFVLFFVLLFFTCFNYVIRKKLYARKSTEISHIERHDDRIQDAYGAFAMIALIVSIPAPIYILQIL